MATTEEPSRATLSQLGFTRLSAVVSLAAIPKLLCFVFLRPVRDASSVEEFLTICQHPVKLTDQWRPFKAALLAFAVGLPHSCGAGDSSTNQSMATVRFKLCI